MKKNTKYHNNLIFLIVLMVLIGLGILLYSQFYMAQKVKTLKSSEIKESQGENLSSVTDFRENSIKGPQYIDISDYKLKISGLVANPKAYEYDEILNDFQNYKKVVTLNCVEGWSAKILWQGVLLRDLLEQSQLQDSAKVVIFHAYDGYTTSFPVEYIMNNNILLAYKMNDIILPPERGFPFQLVAENKWGYKWIKWVTEIELSGNENYKGYWESRGYLDSGNLDEKFLK